MVTKPLRHVFSQQGAFVMKGTPSRAIAAPLAREGVRAAADNHVEKLFDHASDPERHLVTRRSAEKAGYGFLADHFAEIDRDRDGNLRLGEVRQFLDARSPVAKPTSGAIQIIE